MKLVTLNTWGGRSLYPLMKFFERRAKDTDIFCLQEVFHADQVVVDARHPGQHVHAPLFGKISDALSDFNGAFAAFEDNPHRMSLAMFVRKTIASKFAEDVVVHKPKNPKETGSAIFSSRKLQHVTVETLQGEVTIVNYHGLWNNGPKTDTPERILQSIAITKFLETIPGPRVFCGDLNLLPDTNSMYKLEVGMRNLVKEFDVTSTRTPLYRHYDDPDEPNFADYILLSPSIHVLRFEVLPDLVSDHSPLFLEFA